MASWLDKTGLTYFWGKIKSAILKDGIEYINGTQTAATGSWTGVTRDSSLYTGKTIAYRLPYAGSGNATLNLTLAGGGTTGAKEVYLNTTRATTHFGAGAVITMTYDGTRWRADSIPNSNNYDRRLHNQYVLAAANIPQYKICVGTSAGYKPVAASVTFDLAYPILYLSSANQSGQSYAVASGAQTAAMYEAIPSINVANTATVEGVAKNKTVFLKGTISGTTFTIASSNFLTCTVPSSEDNFYYIPIALVGNDWSTSATSKYYFAPRSEIYAYKNGGFKPIENATNVYQKVLALTGGNATLLSADAERDYLALEAGSHVTFNVQNYAGQGDPTVSQGQTGSNIDKIKINAAWPGASDIVSTLGTTAVNRATADASGNNIASTYANQNAFSNVKVGSTTVAADTKTDTLELVAGSNVTLTPDATNDKVTIAATDTTALGSMTGTLGVAHGGTGVATLGAGVVYHSASGTGALSIATAANLVSALGTTAVNRATGDANGDNIANTYYKKSELGSLFYGTCSTAAGTQAKAVTCPTFTSANLVAGTVINVTFTNAQTYNGAPTLNVNSTGAKNIRRNSGNNAARYEWYTGETVQFMYDGTYWIMVNGSMATTTYYGYTKLSDSTSSTDTALAATANAVKKAYDHADAVIATETGPLSLVNSAGGGALEGGGVWKSGNTVTVALQYSSTTAQSHSGNMTLATIPSAWAPPASVRVPLFTTVDWNYSSYKIGYMNIDENGNIAVEAPTTKVLFGSCTFVI